MPKCSSARNNSATDSLMEETPEYVGYRALWDFLAMRGDEVLHFEIVPPGLGSIIIDHLNAGITKKTLVQAFIIARDLFFRPADCSGDRDKKTITLAAPAFDEKTRLASEIILLYDSEHLTACNWRKRRLCHLRSELSIKPKSFREYVTELQKELSFTTTLLNSTLFRHAKSPTIWHHRYWVIQCQLHAEFYPPHLCSPSDPTSPPDELFEYGRKALHRELSVVLRAGEQHPMNYYAFSFMRRLLTLLSCATVLRQRLENLESHDSWEAALGDCPSSGENPDLGKPLAKEIIPRMSEWCQANPRDISGWSFLLYVLTMVDDPTIQRDIVVKTFKYALCIHWAREGLWTFVDIAMCKFQIDTSYLPMPSGNDQDQGRIGVSGIPSKPRGWKAWIHTIWPSLAPGSDNRDAVPP